MTTGCEGMAIHLKVREWDRKFYEFPKMSLYGLPSIVLHYKRVHYNINQEKILDNFLKGLENYISYIHLYVKEFPFFSLDTFWDLSVNKNMKLFCIYYYSIHVNRT